MCAQIHFSNHHSLSFRAHSISYGFHTVSKTTHKRMLVPFPFTQSTHPLDISKSAKENDRWNRFAHSPKRSYFERMTCLGRRETETYFHTIFRNSMSKSHSKQTICRKHFSKQTGLPERKSKPFFANHDLVGGDCCLFGNSKCPAGFSTQFSILISSRSMRYVMSEWS
jgi:hypothetical protein